MFTIAKRPITRIAFAVDEEMKNSSTSTMRYIENMGKINQKIAEAADCVVEAVFGIPVVLKGELPICR